jgi:hypothetical protein
MKNVTLFGAILALCSAPAFAQAPDNTSRPAQTPDSSSQSDPAAASANTAGKKTTMVGCISERNGKYMLMTNNQSSNNSSNNSSNSSSSPDTSQSSQSGSQSGQTGAQGTERSAGSQSTPPQAIELITTQDLKQHVGHTVRVTGTMSNSSSANSTSSSANTNSNSSDANSTTNQSSSTSTNSNRMNRTMNVTDVQMVSETCNMNSGATPQPH